MLNQTYLGLGTQPSVIRELFAYGLEQAKKVGPEKVYDYSLGNPSIPAPAAVNKAICDILSDTDSIKVHGYSMAAGFDSTRAAIADNLNRRFGLNLTAANLFLTCGAAPALISTIKALLGEDEAEIMAVAPFFPEYRPFTEANGGKLTVELNGRSFRLYGQKAGSCTVTVKADEGSVTLPVTVEPSSQPVTPPQPSSGWTSDTTTDLTLSSGASYQFKFTASKPDQINVWMGTPNVFSVQKTAVEANAVYYKITAVGTPGAQAGIYVSYEGGAGTKLCVATIAGGSSGGSSSGSGGTTQPAATLICDTTSDFGLARGASYQFRITTSDGKKPSFWAGTSGVFDVQYVTQSGKDFFYKITAVGNPGAQAGFYAACEGQSGVKQCVVTIAYG